MIRSIYDALGNRSGSNNNVASRNAGSVPISFSRRDNGLNQYSSWTPSVIYHDDNSGAPYVYPGNGVMMADGWIAASYNALNQPIAIWSPTYAGTPNFVWFGHDPLGRCVKRWVGESGDVYSNPATYFHYDGWNLLQEGNNAWGPSRIYMHGNRVDEIVASYNTWTGEYAYHHYDARGHCTLLTDRGGNILEQYEYDAFGQPYIFGSFGQALTTGSAFGNRFLFTGREWLSDLRIYDFRNRHYQPELGRFLQPDPIQFKAGDYSLYRYCHNDPVNKTDPLGLLGWPGAIYGALSGFGTELLLQATDNALNERPLLSNLDYGSAATFAAIGAGTGAVGYGVVANTGKAATATKRAWHVRNVLKARKEAQEKGKFRNPNKTETLKREMTEEATEAAKAVGKGAVGPGIKLTIEKIAPEPKPAPTPVKPHE